MRFFSLLYHLCVVNHNSFFLARHIRLDTQFGFPSLYHLCYINILSASFHMHSVIPTNPRYSSVWLRILVTFAFGQHIDVTCFLPLYSVIQHVERKIWCQDFLVWSQYDRQLRLSSHRRSSFMATTGVAHGYTLAVAALPRAHDHPLPLAGHPNHGDPWLRTGGLSTHLHPSTRIDHFVRPLKSLTKK